MRAYPNASFRLGDLSDEVLARGKNAGQIAKRDLMRYYSLLRRLRPRFDEEEAGYIIAALSFLQSQTSQRVRSGRAKKTQPDLVSEHRNSLSAAVRQADDIAGLSEKYHIDLTKLEAKLRELDQAEELAVLDAVEQALTLTERDPRRAAKRVGLA